MKAEDVVAQLEAAAHRKRVEAEALDEAANKIGVALQVEEELKERRASSRPRSDRKTAAAKRPRTPTAKSRAAVLEALGKTEGTMTVQQLAKQTGLTTSAVKRGVSSIDGDLLQVVQERRTDPAQYSLKPMREEVRV